MQTLDDFKNGQVLLIDKPLTWTSFQAVNKLRWSIKQAFNIKKIKVGHAGTLDPLATGLLVICTGKMTKQISTFQGQEKDIIYISMVRSNDRAEIGFLKDYRRTNVAMTRAKMKMVMIGNSVTFGNDPFYSKMIDYFQEKDAYTSAWEYIS